LLRFRLGAARSALAFQVTERPVIEASHTLVPLLSYNGEDKLASRLVSVLRAY